LRPVDSSEAIEGVFHMIDGSLSALWDRDAGTLSTAVLPADKTQPFVLQCRSGGRVTKAIAFLKQQGYTNVVQGGGPADPEIWECYGDRVVQYDHSCFSLTQLFDDSTSGGASSTLTYIIADLKTKEALIIDPVLEQVDRDLAVVEKLGLKLTLALNTHCHADHVTGTGELKKRVPELKSLISAASGAQADVLLQPDETVAFTDGTPALKVLATPGHTNGCVSFHCEKLNAVFTGDAVLIGGCGRTDFQEGSAETLYKSVHTQLFTLPDSCLVLPAHDYKGRRRSTIGAEKKTNARLTKTAAEFIEIMANLGLPYPKQIDTALPRNLVCGC